MPHRHRTTNETKTRGRGLWAPLCAFAAMLLICACSSIDCPMNSSVYTVYNFCKADGTADTLKDSISIITFQRTPEQDGVIVNRDVNVSKLKVPISYEGAQDVLYFIRFWSKETSETLYAGTDSATVVTSQKPYQIVDTVTISKTDRMHLESVNCNPSFFHTIQSVSHTKNGIDSIVINNSEVNYDSSKEHFHIYFNAHD